MNVAGNGSGNGAIVNSSTTPAVVNAEILNNATSFSVSGPGNITLQRVQMATIQTLTYNGVPGSVLTLGTAAATNHNNLLALVINGGEVDLNMPATSTTAPFNTNLIAVDRGLTIANDGIAKFTAGSTNMLQHDQPITMTDTSVFDLNGFSAVQRGERHCWYHN